MRMQDGRATDDLDARQMAAEDLMLGMRMSQGVSDAQVKQAEALGLAADEAFTELSEQSLVVHENGRWRPTERGWLCGNELYGRLFDLA